MCKSPQLKILGEAIRRHRSDAGLSTWVVGSDRNSKKNVSTIEPREILKQVIALPIQTWSYKAQTNPA